MSTGFGYNTSLQSGVQLALPEARLLRDSLAGVGGLLAHGYELLHLLQCLLERYLPDIGSTALHDEYVLAAGLVLGALGLLAAYLKYPKKDIS